MSSNRKPPKFIFSHPIFTFRTVSADEADISQGFYFYLRCERCVYEKLDELFGSSSTVYLGAWPSFYEFKKHVTLQHITDWIYYFEHCPGLPASCFHKPTSDIIQCRRCTACLSFFNKQTVEELLYHSNILCCF